MRAFHLLCSVGIYALLRRRYGARTTSNEDGILGFSWLACHALLSGTHTHPPTHHGTKGAEKKA